MADDTEVLDWGHEEEDGVAVASGEHRSFAEDDVEDAVSLGGDEEDEFLTYQSRVPQGTMHRDISPPKSARQYRQDPPKSHTDFQRTSQHQTSQEQLERKESTEQSSLRGRAHSFGKLVHALPPKPVMSSVPRLDRDKRNGGSSKTANQDHQDPLPPGWEIRHPRSGRGVYYYNVLTEESTWTRPTATPREKHRRDDPLDTALPSRSEETLLARVGRADSGDLSYDDRHYRPADSGRREERSAQSSQLMDTYIPDSYSPNPRNSRSSPPPRTRDNRDNDSAQPSRRPLSPLGSHGDRDATQGSHREAPPVVSVLSAEDRVWVARDIIPLERPRERERKQRDHSAPSETERRNLPRDTDRSSTLRPRSPISYSRDSKESASVMHASSKLSQPISEAPSTGRKSRFSQADASDQFNHRQPESRDGGLHRARTDDTVPHSSRYPDDIPNARSRSDIRGDDDTLHPPADAQRSGSRKRTPLPPQEEVFRPNSRSVAGQRDSGYPSAPAGPAASLRESRHSRPASVDRPRRRSPSPPPPPPQVDHSTTERGDRDHARSRRSKPSANGPAVVDSYVPHESSGDRDRAHNIAMDIDDAPPPRLSDPPSKQSVLRRPVQQDEVPRYPRAMLSAENDGLSRGATTPREPREAAESRHRSSVDEPSRSGHGRERQAMERYPVDQHVAPKEPSRTLESKPPPAASSVRLSGTNNTPIGSRNKFTGSAGVPPPPATPPVQSSSSGRRVAAVSGSNLEPVGTRQSRSSKDYERPPHLDPPVGERMVERGAPIESARREDARPSPLSNPRALPPVESPPAPTRPSRAALGTSRFGPPIVKESAEPARRQRNVSSESIGSEPLRPEGSLHATPPPPSREPSMTSVHDTNTTLSSVRPAHLPPRPETPPRGYRYRSEEENRQQQPRRKVQSPVNERREQDVEAVTRQRLPSPAVPRKRGMDTYTADPAPAPREAREERPRATQRDVDVVGAPGLVVQEEDRVRPPPAMHPERALMLQANGLPPRPPSGLSRPRSGRSSRRDRRDDRDRAEPLRGGGGGGGGGARYASPVSPGGGDRQRYPAHDPHPPQDERGPGERGLMSGGGSLLDRLTLDKSPTLRDRVELPSKRDREEMLAGSGEVVVDANVEDYDGSKRARRRGGGGGGGGKGRRRR